MTDKQVTMPDADEIVDVIRAQNWKLGGVLVIDRDEAVALVAQAIEAARSAGHIEGMNAMHASHMRTLDAFAPAKVEGQP